MEKALIFILFTAVCAYAADPVPIIAVKGSDQADFGTYPAKERKEAFFKITNKGEDVLNIVGIRKTCGCAEAKMDKTEIKPGEAGILKAVVLGDSIYGSYNKHVFVFSNDPTQKFLKLTIAGKAVPILVIKPKDTIFTSPLPPDKEWKQEFLLEATENGVKLADPVIETDTGAKAILTKKSDKLYHLAVVITPEKGKLDFKCKIKVPVTEPKGWKAPEILIMGKIQ